MIVLPPPIEPPSQQPAASAADVTISSSVQQELPDLVPAQPDEGSPQWRDELSRRVGNFRKRRARLQAEEPGNFELEFDTFDTSEKLLEGGFTSAPVVSAASAENEFDLDLRDAIVDRKNEQLIEPAVALADPAEATLQLDAPAAGDEELTSDDTLEPVRPMEIVVGAPQYVPYDVEEPDLFLAPLRRRFLAGFADALILFLGAGVFGLIFWRVCGTMSLAPLNVAVLGILAVILIFSYFAVFTSLASATPGLLWLGCEIRNARGEHPTTAECVWRAFGVLVSMSALMLGFVWACLDSEGLTWHDRMSGTVITEEHTATELSTVKAEI